jgi:hypothetical protein
MQSQGVAVSRRDWTCRNRTCGAVLGRLTLAGDGLVLAPGVAIIAAYFDTGRVEIACPACGAHRDFRGRAVRRETP